MNDIRRALDDLVGTPPVNLGRRGAVMSRINRVHHRRKVAVQAALSAVVVAGASFGATQVITATPAGSDKLYVEPAEQPTYDAEPKPSKEPSTKRPDKPKPTVASEKPAEPGTTAKPYDPDSGPTYPGTKPADPKPTYTKPTYTKPDPKPVYPTKTADGLSVEFWPYTDAAAGAPMDWKVKAYDGAGRLLRIEVLFGDGTKAVHEPAEACGAGVSVKQFFTHTYAKAGTYDARATVTTGGCGAATETKVATHRLTVAATAAAKPDNGPAVPTVSAEKVSGGASVTLQLHGGDADGYVKKFWVDWGDGSAETTVGPRSLDGCTADPSTGRPGASSWSPTASHGYKAPGTYTVKVVVMSTACDASDGQTATYTMTVTA